MGSSWITGRTECRADSGLCEVDVGAVKVHCALIEMWRVEGMVPGMSGSGQCFRDRAFLWETSVMC